MHLSVRIALCLSLLISTLLSAQAWALGEDEFLPVHEAFQVRSELEGNLVHYSWTIAEGYYLYKHRFSFDVAESSTGTLGEPHFDQPGEWKDDPIFGRVQVFHHQVNITVPVTAADGGFIEIDARYQGCAEKGLCYIPQTYTDMYQVDAAAIAANPEDKLKSPDLDALAQAAATGTPTQATRNQPLAAALQQPVVAPIQNPDLDENDALSLENFLATSGFFSIVGVFFLIGIGLTFTPCVLPMVPILSSIIVGQGKALSRTRAGILSSIYVVGMAVTYAAAGVLAGLSGKNLAVAMQNPTTLFSFAAVFVVLSLSMFGFYELQLPAFIRDRLSNASQKQQGGTYAGVLVIGILSALIVSPCVSAPLAGALLYISKTGNWLLGGTSLLALGFGMGAPLIAIGVTGANILPKAGGWMDNVKALFGIVLLAVALYLVKHLIPEAFLAAGWGALAILAGLYLGAFDPLVSPRGKLFKGIGIAAVILGAILIFNAFANPGVTSATPASALSSTPFQKIRTLAQLDEQLASARANQQPVLIDYFADWCVACFEMEHETFSQADVQQQLRGYRWIQIDLTDNPEDQALLDRFAITGPPSILFFGPNGQEMSAARIYAYKSRTQFLQHLVTHRLSPSA